MTHIVGTMLLGEVTREAGEGDIEGADELVQGKRGILDVKGTAGATEYGVDMRRTINRRVSIRSSLGVQWMLIVRSS
jgi:hypothetical protein